jgi:hypothetical protein
VRHFGLRVFVICGGLWLFVSAGKSIDAAGALQAEKIIFSPLLVASSTPATG